MDNNEDFLELFEQKLCKYTNSPFAVVVDRCTNAILLSLQYLNKRNTPIGIPCNTYLSIPMTLINYGYTVYFTNTPWKGNYKLENTNVYDYAVGFEKNMYVSGQIQCLSFQQKKRLAIGKGGAILLDDEQMYHRLKRMRHDGRTSNISVIKEMEQGLSNIIIGYHMNMSPDEAAKGILLLNQINDQDYINGSFKDYPNISKLECFKILQ